MRRRTSTVIAAAALVGCVAGISWYVYEGSPDGSAETIGEAAGAALIPAVIALAIARGSFRQARWDVVFAVAAVLLLYTDRGPIADAYDTRQFQAEVRSAGAANAWKVAETSRTRIAGDIRVAMRASKDANAKIAAIFAEIEDPKIWSVLTPSALSQQGVSAAVVGTTRTSALVATAMDRIDRALADEREAIRAGMADQPRYVSDNMLRGVGRRQAEFRRYYVLQASIDGRALNSLSEILSLLISLNGRYRVDGPKVLFEDEATLALYNQDLAALQGLLRDRISLGEEEQKFMADWRAHDWLQVSG
jgi:hypothetical protein